MQIEVLLVVWGMMILFSILIGAFTFFLIKLLIDYVLQNRGKHGYRSITRVGKKKQ